MSPLDPTQDLPSARVLIKLAAEAEQAKNEANTINDAEGFAIEHARQYALEALAWVAYVRVESARKARSEHYRELARG